MATSLPHNSNVGLLEINYERWRQNPAAVDPVWSAFFEGFELGNTAQSNGTIQTGQQPNRTGAKTADPQWQTKVDQLVLSYRSLGHLKAHTNPLSANAPESNLLSLSSLGFSDADLSSKAASLLFRDGTEFQLGELVQQLESIYCGHIGAEFSHIENPVTL